MPENIFIRSPETEREWDEYYWLRWLILRKPWNQPLGSEKDNQEHDSYHCAAIDINNAVVGVGRLHKVDDETVQIRYMAVANALRRQGIGSMLLEALEEKARSQGAALIVLNARDSNLAFYCNNGYIAVGKGPILFSSITHTRMKKTLST